MCEILSLEVSKSLMWFSTELFLFKIPPVFALVLLSVLKWTFLSKAGPSSIWWRSGDDLFECVLILLPSCCLRLLICVCICSISVRFPLRKCEKWILEIYRRRHELSFSLSPAETSREREIVYSRQLSRNDTWFLSKTFYWILSNLNNSIK